MNRRAAFLCVIVGVFVGLAWPMNSAAQTGECIVPPDGLVAWWPGDGDATDIQGINDGIPQGGLTFASGHVGNGFSLDGVDDFVSVPSAASLNFGTATAFTIDVWIRIDGPNTIKHRIINKGEFPGPSFKGWDVHYDTTPNAIRAFIADGEGKFCVLDGSTDVADGMFHHVAVVFHRTPACDSDTIQIYIDGVRENTTLQGDAASPSTDVNTLNPLQLGALGDAFEPFDGLMDEIEIFNRPLAATEILAIFEAGSAGKCKDEDGDGFRPPDDCDETDPTVNPNATEIIFNFVDENCDGDLGDCDPCLDWQNHGQYVRCVSDAVSDCSLHSFTPEEADAFVNSAVHSDIGKTGYVPPECPQP
jgi:hypothetical protein